MHRRSRRAATTAVFALLSLLAGASTAQQAEWVRERVGLLALEGPTSAAPAVRALSSHAREILSQLESDLGTRPARAFRMVLVPASGLDDSTLARIDESAPPWAAGYLLPELRLGAIRIAKAASYPYGTLESVLAHESAHMLLHDAVGRGLPLWFEEGVATAQGRRWSAEDAWTYSRALLTSDLPALSDLDGAFHASAGEAELAYAASFAFVSWNARKHPGLVPRLLRELRSRPFPAAWRTVTGEPLARAEADWRRQSLIRYRWIPVLTASSTFWIGISFLAVWAGARRRARAREARERWAEEEEEGAAGEPP